MPTFFWHDYETTGADPMRDRPLQFAGLRTNQELEPVDDPVVYFCKPPRDRLPHPEATLITGITPQQAEREGHMEAEFAARVHEQLARPGTCGVGYNSLRFDDTLTRFLLYRNFYPPYAREWQHGNSRWDIIDLARMCYALRPAGIQWPQREDGAPSFRLEHLASANQIEQTRAHDALSDVEATLGLARLLRRTQPRLWDWYFKLRSKRHAIGMLDLGKRTPLLHVSARYPATHGCLRIILPVAMHPEHSNEVIIVDLSKDPTPLLQLDSDTIANRLFTPTSDLPEGMERTGLRTLRINRSPALAPLGVLKGVATARLQLDVDACLAHAHRLQAAPDLADKLRRVYAQVTPRADSEDADLALYGGFPDTHDKGMIERTRATPPEQLASLRFHAPRYQELLFRYRARNWEATLDRQEHARWQAFRRQRLLGDDAAEPLTLPAFFAHLAALRHAHTGKGRELRLLDQLKDWGLALQGELDGDGGA